jgi:pimeloyl-ACP methyl ester carboxylesterase
MHSMRHVDVGGFDLDYLDTGGDGPCVVLLHGALMDQTLWRDVIHALGPEVRCVVPVLPMGAHRRPAPGSADLTPAGQAAMVVSLLEALDLQDVTLVGNDTGGAIAQLLATSRPERVGGLVLVSCDAFENFPPGLPGRTMALACRVPGGLYLAMLSLRMRVLRRLPMTFGWMTRRPIADEVFSAWLDAYLADSGVRRDVKKLMRGVDREQLVEAGSRLRGFRGQSMVVWGRDDKVMPVDHAWRLSDALGAAEVHLVDDSRTLVPLDQPERLAELVRSFALQV